MLDRIKACFTESIQTQIAAAEALLALVKTRRGNTNKDNAKLTGQIVSLIEKWKK